MNSPERHFTRYMDHDWGDGTFGRNDRVLYTCDEEGPDSPIYDEHFRPITLVADEEGRVAVEPPEPIAPQIDKDRADLRRGAGLQSSWAILARGETVIAEEPISHDLCDALTARDRLADAAPALLAACVAVVRNLAVEVPLGNSTIGQCLDAIYAATGEGMTDEDFLDVAARGMEADNG